MILFYVDLIPLGQPYMSIITTIFVSYLTLLQFLPSFKMINIEFYDPFTSIKFGTSFAINRVQQNIGERSTTLDRHRLW